MATPAISKGEREFTDSFEDFFELDSWKSEWGLFLSRACIDNKKPLRCWVAGLFVKDGKQQWIDRLCRWQDHLDEYDKIVDVSEQKSASSTAEQSPAALVAKARILRLTQLHSFLSILDNKIGMSLSFNSLLLGAVGVFLTWVPGLLEKAPDPHWKLDFLLAFRGLTVLVLGILLTSLWVLLLGFRRVVWGDLTRTRATDSVEKAKEYSRFLIISLTRRTNAFRISTYLTKFALAIVGFLIVMAMVLSLRSPFWGLKQAKDEAGQGSVFIQVDSNNQEIGQGSGNDMRNEEKNPGTPAPPNGGKIPRPARQCDRKIPEPPKKK
jgi:hypothetical protein